MTEKNDLQDLSIFYYNSSHFLPCCLHHLNLFPLKHQCMRCASACTIDVPIKAFKYHFFAGVPVLSSCQGPLTNNHSKYSLIRTAQSQNVFQMTLTLPHICLMDSPDLLKQEPKLFPSHIQSVGQNIKSEIKLSTLSIDVS